MPVKIKNLVKNPKKGGKPDKDKAITKKLNFKKRPSIKVKSDK